MIERLKSRPTLAAFAAAAITALGVGGVAVAQSGGSPAEQPAQAKNEAAEQPDAPENSAADRDNVQEENGQDDATEKAEGNEQAEGSEKAEGNEKADDDGPGGHADEPGNPNADHEAQGQE